MDFMNRRTSVSEIIAGDTADFRMGGLYLE